MSETILRLQFLVDLTSQLRNFLLGHKEKPVHQQESMSKRRSLCVRYTLTNIDPVREQLRTQL